MELQENFMRRIDLQEILQTRYEEFCNNNSKTISFYGENNFNDEQPNFEVIDSLIKLSFDWKNFGELEKAKDFCENLLDSAKKNFDKNDVRITFVMENLAEILNRLGQHHQALELEEKVLKLRREFLGEEDFLTVCSMSNMAVMLMEFDMRLNDALLMEQTVLNYFKENFGDNHKLTLGSMSNLADIFRKIGNYYQALLIEEKIFKICKEIYGEKNSLTIHVMSKLADILSELGHDEKSLTLTEQVFALRKEMLGKGHIDTMTTMADLAERFQKVGRHKEAAALWQEQIEMIFVPDEEGDIRTYIDSNFDATNEDDFDSTLEVLNPMIHLAKALIDLGENDEALDWANHSLTLGKKFFPVLMNTEDEFYDEIDCKKCLEVLNEWHALFLKKFNGDEVNDFDEVTSKVLILIPRTITAMRYDDENFTIMEED